MGGRGQAKEVVARVRTIMEHQFLEADFEVLASGQPRWEKNTNWARYFLKQQGLLAADSPRGVWEITEAGRAYLREHQWERRQK
jgi:restriction system protein